MTNNNITISIEEAEKENAKALTQSYARGDIKSRAYVNALGAEVCTKYLRDNNISTEDIYNLHNIRKILEELDISDIMLSNIHIDVRVIFNENQIFIPKSHFEFNVVPDIYIIFKASKDYSSMEFLGFFEPKMLNKKNTNGEYYFIEKEKLSSPVDLKTFIDNYEGSTSKEMSEQETENAEFLIVSMADHNVSEADKKQLINYLKNSAKLRNSFIEFENFEMLAYQAVNTLELEPTAETEMLVEDITTNNTDITEEIEASTSILGKEIDITEKESENSSNLLGEAIAGAGILGAEITGAAVASAALAGAVEGAEIAMETAAGVVEGATEITAETIEAAAETLLPETQENTILEEPTTLDNIEETSMVTEEATDKLPETQEPEQEISSVITSETESLSAENFDMSALDEFNSTEETAEPNNNFADLQSSLDTLFSDEDDNTQAATMDMPSFDNMNNSYDDSSSELVFSNDDDYGDELVFENNDDYDDMDSQMSSAKSSGSMGLPALERPVISPTIHTPISEATELFSLESIRLGDIPPLEMPKDELETMEMDEFQSLVDNYKHEPIKDMSETIDFNKLSSNSIGEEKSSEAPSFNDEEMMSVNDFTEEAVRENKNNIIGSEELSSDDFVQDLPEETGNEIIADKLSSDDFVQDMPEETGKAIIPDELSSDDFMQDMPEALNQETRTDELSSDDFMQDMPEALNQEARTDELSSDDFVQDMPEELLGQETMLPDMPEEMNLESNLALDELEDINAEELLSSENTEEVNEIKEEEQPQNVSAEASENISETEASIDDLDSLVSEFGDMSELDGLDGLDGLDSINNENNAMSGLDELDSINNENNAMSGLDELDSINNETNVMSGLDELDSINNENNAMSGLDELDSINNENNAMSGLDELDSINNETNAVSDINELNNINNKTNINKPANTSAQEHKQIGVLYNNSEKQITESDIQGSMDGNYDFKPKKKGINLMPVFAILAAIIIAGSVVGFLVKNKNSLDAETLVQSSPDELMSNPETNNTDVLANNNTIEPAIPTEMDDVTPAPVAASSPAIPKEEKQEMVKNAKEAIKQQQQKAMAKTPVNASKTITLKKLSWEVPDYLSYSDNIRKYLQAAGKSIKLTLSSDLLLTNEYIYSNQVKVNLKLAKDGTIQDAQVIASSGSNQVDKIVLQTVKDTLNVVKPPQGEVPTPNYNLGLTIYL